MRAKISVHRRLTCSTCSVQQIPSDGQIEPVRCPEIRMTCQLHNIIFRKAVLKPACQTRTPQVVKLTKLDTSMGQYDLPLACEVVYGTCAVLNCPVALLASLLYVDIA
ncbi:MAG TPA: hypothetical protein VMW72_21620 [Sedimentisphaerales bacterium]|nr:hypothetical protein [Sedimentisphaerales bacterium]